MPSIQHGRWLVRREQSIHRDNSRFETPMAAPMIKVLNGTIKNRRTSVWLGLALDVLISSEFPKRFDDLMHSITRGVLSREHRPESFGRV